VLLKLSRIFGVSIAGLALAQVAWAQGGSATNVTTDANSMKVGGEFRSELIYDDHGFQKAEGFTPDKTTTIQVTNVNLKMAGNVNSNTEYAFRFNLLDPGQGSPLLQYGYGTHWFSKMVGFSIGRMKTMQGGYDNMDASYRSHTTAVLAGNLAFADYEDMIALTLKVAGEVKLQILNDHTVASGGEWNKSAHPTWVLGWMGEFGGIHPMIDIGSYDNNKSRYFDVAIKTAMAGLNASLDYHNNNVVHKVMDGTKAKEEADVRTAIALNVGYEVKGVATPWLHFSTFDNKQADNKDFAMEDRKVNGYDTDASGAKIPTWDDNGQVIGVGADLAMMGKGWNPFVALVIQSGKFDKNAGAGAKVEEETKSNTWLKLGVLGEI
jgi:hypothetical protein